MTQAWPSVAAGAGTSRWLLVAGHAANSRLFLSSVASPDAPLLRCSHCSVPLPLPAVNHVPACDRLALWEGYTVGGLWVFSFSHTSEWAARGPFKKAYLVERKLVKFFHNRYFPAWASLCEVATQRYLCLSCKEVLKAMHLSTYIPDGKKSAFLLKV